MMTNRFERLTTVELDQVTGGYNHETSMDSCFLNDMGTGCDRYGSWKISVNYDNCCDDVARHWNEFGITVATSHPTMGDWCGHPNVYYLNGSKVSRTDAILHVADALGRTVDPGKYN